MRLIKIFLVFAIFILIFIVSCSKNPSSGEDEPGDGYAYIQPPETGDGWQTASLSDVGINKNKIIDIIIKIQNQVYKEVHSVVIVKDGKLVFEEYFSGHDFGYYGENYHGRYINFDRDTRHNTHSATKSITSALVGIAIDKGFIKSVNDSIFSYLPTKYASLKNEQKNKITFEHLLTMTSGLEWNEWDLSVSESNHDVVRFNSSSDPIRYLLSKSVVTEPGTSFYYNGGAVDLLGELIRIAAKTGVKEFSRKYLFEPLGISNYQWQTLYPSGITCCHGDIYITPRDLAKFGFLFLNNGVWNGNQIISESWVKKSTETFIDLNLSWADSYGYLWWLKKYSANNKTYQSFFAEGWGGQKIAVFSELKLVVVFTGANYVSNPPCDEILTRFILPALQ